MLKTRQVRRYPRNEESKQKKLLSLGFEIISVQSNLEHQQTRGDHRKLRQFGLREFFYSQIRVHIAPRARPGKPGEVPPWRLSPSKSTFLRATTHAAPAVLSFVLLVLVLGMYNDLGRLRTSLDRCGTPGPNWNAAPAPSVTVTATVVSHHHHHPTSTAGTDVEWDPDSAPTFPDSDSDASARSAPEFVTMIDITSPQSADKRERASSGDASVHGEHNALLPIERLPLLWPPIRFELPFTREQALEVVEQCLGVAWQILRRAYHFPLDPP